jgi:tetratricopeptide (TPR) repeat protein
MRMLVRVHNNLSLVDCQRGRFEEAVSHAEAGVEVAGQLGDVRSMAKAQAYLGTALAGAGRKEDAKAAFEKGASLAAKAGDASLQKEIMKEFSGVHRAGRR